MTSGPPAPESQGEPSWAEKVLGLNAAFAQRHLPYAFGGAISLNYHREPRSTLDIAINVFLDPADREQALDVLRALYGLPDAERVTREVDAYGQARSTWGSTYVDLFFSNTEFHHSMARRVHREQFGDVEIPVLSIEDLLVCKALFDRAKDWVDIDAVAQTRAGSLDRAYMESWVGYFLESDDSRAVRIRRVLGE